MLARNGVETTSQEVVLTETGYDLGNDWYGAYPAINEQNRAKYIKQAVAYWSQWPEVRAVTPFQLVDTGGSWKEFEWIRPTSGPDENGYPNQARLQYARLLPGTGVIVGTVRDRSGSSLKGVTISASEHGHQALTTQGGSYVMIAYPGSYQLSADKLGYLTGSAGDVVVTEGGLNVVDFTLEGNLPPVARNPGGESGDLDNWTPFGEADGIQRGPWYNGIEAKDGRYFIGTASNCVEKDGGFYQSIAVTPGSSLKVSVWALTYKEGAEPMGNRLGVDPYGGTDPQSSEIQWSPWLETAGRWKRLSVVATAQSDKLTVFLQHDQNAANPWNINAFDTLEVTEAP